ncbi:transducin/WD40 repeat-like superfamily protein isoform X2 [Carex rostrata]
MAANTKRAYKLQEFVAHSSNVNCLKIGRKTSRVLVTGGEDHKVNLWAIGKPNSILSLSGHTSAIESVSFDSSEVFVAAGAASGTIKLWDLEEAKIVRTLTGHRSNCISVDFHPFGEFFASGSLDTNLKIWDIRRKGCIHTYKGHTRGVNAIRFTPDGRWVVSGGEDNTIKLWDLTAGKLLHEFKSHEGQVQCIDFHPHEFLLATGSADKTVKFWDLESFELIGTSGPETTGVRAMTFNPDGRTLLCGLHENLKTYSWEPIRCHDSVDVGWSRLSDLNIHEGKLLGCSFNQSCVGVWVVDLSRVEPYVTGISAKLNGLTEPRPTSTVAQSETSIKSSMARLSVAQNSEASVKSTTVGRIPIAQSNDSTTKETKLVPSAPPSTPQRTGVSSAKINTPTASSGTLKRNSSRSHGTGNFQAPPVIVPRATTRSEMGPDSRTESADVAPVIAPRSNTRAGPTPNSKKEAFDVPVQIFVPPPSSRNEGRTSPFVRNSKLSEPLEGASQNLLPTRNGSSHASVSRDDYSDIRHFGGGRVGPSPMAESAPSQRFDSYNMRAAKPRESCYVEVSRGGRTRSLVASWENREPSPPNDPPSPSGTYSSRANALSTDKLDPQSDDDGVSELMDQHGMFLSSARSRLTKMQVVHQHWARNDVKGVISSLEKISDHAVSADVVSVLTEKAETITLDLCTCLLPLLAVLLESQTERHLSISLELLIKLVRTFGSMIHSTVAAGPSSVGVDLQMEQRVERCNLCFIELEKVKNRLSSLVRRKGTVGKTAQELSLALQEVL